MSDTEGAIEVELPPENAPAEAPKEDVIVEIAGENVAKASDDDDEHDVEKQLKKLKKRLEKEKQARKEAEERARQAQTQLHAVSNEVDDTQLQLVHSAIETVKRDNEILKSNYSQAMASGDYERAAEINEVMNGNSIKLRQLEDGRAAMQNKPKAPPPVSDPVEHFASQLSPRSAEWIRKHPQCVTDQRLMQKMVAAHNLAVADGFKADSDDYFEFIEDTLRLNRREKKQEDREEDSPLSKASKPSSRQSPPPPAPANRNGSSRPTVVNLSAQEAEIARSWGWTPEEYAKHKVSLQRDGRMN